MFIHIGDLLKVMQSGYEYAEKKGKQEIFRQVDECIRRHNLDHQKLQIQLHISHLFKVCMGTLGKTSNRLANSNQYAKQLYMPI